MIRSQTYRFIAVILSVSILVGVTLPSGLHAMSDEVCNDMAGMHPPMNEHAQDCPMSDMTRHQNNTDAKHHSFHDLGFACACSVDEAPVKTEVQLFQKVKVLEPKQTGVLEERTTEKPESDDHIFLIADSYSPPPIFLANESFLI